MADIPHIHGGRAWAREERKRLIALRNEIEEARAETKLDAFVQQFVDMTPQQVLTYVDANVNDLASAKLLLKRMAVLLLVIAKKEYKE